MLKHLLSLIVTATACLSMSIALRCSALKQQLASLQPGPPPPTSSTSGPSQVEFDKLVDKSKALFVKYKESQAKLQRLEAQRGGDGGSGGGGGNSEEAFGETIAALQMQLREVTAERDAARAAAATSDAGDSEDTAAAASAAAASAAVAEENASLKDKMKLLISKYRQLQAQARQRAML